MKKLFSQFLLLALVCAPSVLFSQVLNGVVHSVLNVGTYDYAYIYVQDEGVYYKTAAYSANSLDANMQVTINLDLNFQPPYNGYVSNNELQIGIYATQIETESFNLPLTSTYGMPILENEILFFSSQDHFDEFYQILTDFATSPYEEMWDLLMLFEDQYPGFVSFNAMLENEFHINAGDVTPANFELFLKKDYFSDMIIKAILNEYSEIGIGNEVHTLLLNEEINKGGITVIIPKTDLQGIDDKRSIPVEDLSKIKIKYLKYDVAVGGFKYNGQTSKAQYFLGTNTNGTSSFVDYKHSIIATNIDCEIFEKQATVVLERSTDSLGTTVINPNLWQGTATINWGDGQITTHNFGPMDVIFNGKLGYAEVNAGHVYLANGTYSVSYTVTYQPEVNGELAITEIGSSDPVTVGAACAERENHPDAQTANMPGNNNYFMVFDSWISNWWLYRTVGTFTDCYKVKNNGNIDKTNGNIWCQINAVYRNDDCNDVGGDPDETDSKYGKHVQAVMYRWFKRFHTSNGDTYSYNRYEKTTTIYEGIPLNPCE